MRSLLAALLLSTVSVAQTVYYVDAVNGNDLNPGTTRVQAFRSISFASSFLADDDTLIILPGIYSPTLTGELFPIKFGELTSQRRIDILCEGGPQTTILDGEQQATSSLIPLMRFFGQAEGARLRGLQFTNTGSSDYWSMCIRLGSTSGGNFACKSIEIAGCWFTNVYRGIVVFGSDNTLTSPQGMTTDCSIHDNLFEGATHRSLAIWGDGTNYVFNNTIVNGGYEGIYVDSLGSANGQGPSNAVVVNNVVVGCSTVGSLGGITVGSTSPTSNAAFDSNLAFNNLGGDFVGATFNATNIVADPLFVGANDYHLTAGSPAVQTGSNRLLRRSRLDFDAFSRAHDSDGDGNARIDRGAFQYTQHWMTVSGAWVPGGSLSFVFAAPNPGGAVLIFAFREGSLRLQPFGIVAFDPLAILAATAAGGAPGRLPLQVPNDPNLLGNKLVVQGGYVGSSGPIHLLNAYTRVF